MVYLVEGVIKIVRLKDLENVTVTKDQNGQIVVSGTLGVKNYFSEEDLKNIINDLVGRLAELMLIYKKSKEV